MFCLNSDSYPTSKIKQRADSSLYSVAFQDNHFLWKLRLSFWGNLLKEASDGCYWKIMAITV